MCDWYGQGGLGFRGEEKRAAERSSSFVRAFKYTVFATPAHLLHEASTITLSRGQSLFPTVLKYYSSRRARVLALVIFSQKTPRNNQRVRTWDTVIITIRLLLLLLSIRLWRDGVRRPVDSYSFYFFFNYIVSFSERVRLKITNYLCIRFVFSYAFDTEMANDVLIYFFFLFHRTCKIVRFSSPPLMSVSALSA